jgi:iron complex transport system substrate-binding protein
MERTRGLALRRAFGRALVWSALLFGLACGRETSSPEPAAQTSSPEPAAQTANRIVVLAPSLARVLVTLGAADRVVGVDRFSGELPELADRPLLGALLAPDLERLLELQPDLVLGVQGAQQQPLFARLRTRGVRVETFRLHRLDEVFAAFERLGAWVGQADAGRALAARVRGELAAIAESTARRAHPGVAIVLEREPLFVVGAGSFANDLVTAAGGRNVFADLPDAYPRVSLEALAARAPDVVLETLADSPGAEEESRAYWSRFGFVRRVGGVPRGDVVLPGPDLGRAARLLRAELHPDLGAGPP